MAELGLFAGLDLSIILSLRVGDLDFNSRSDLLFIRARRPKTRHT